MADPKQSRLISSFLSGTFVSLQITKIFICWTLVLFFFYKKYLYSDRKFKICWTLQKFIFILYFFMKVQSV